ncbi:MAG: bifunctional serine/threonine-protein kinase/formylglycine-generating enzyme family protein [Verrucomicrobia bacterium]|nr:bifunctional serine/threonine-protein kinase/formylglycine-generating enzyme family protein [Verrucomicrobiota bacterium]
MSETRSIKVTCPRCGLPQPERMLVGGLCAACVAGSMRSDLLLLDEPDLEEKEPNTFTVQGYEIHELVGGGGMGEVYRAIMIAGGCDVAMKVVAGRLTRDPETAARFEAEVAALSQLNHPNVVRVLDHGEMANGRHFLVMEYVDGCDLRRLLRAQRLDTERAFDIFSKVCAGVAHAHDHNLVHRDIKPANILIGQDGTVKVADFGLAKTLVDSTVGYSFTQTRDTFGTPYYVAPEVTRHARAADARADVYALGVLLYELLSGVVPMGQFTPLSQITGLDRSIDALVSQALADDPARRLASVSDFAVSVERIAAEHRLGPVKQKRRMKWIVAAATITVLGIGAAVGAWWSAKRDGDERSEFRAAVTATKENPWTNSLEMKFVPVPETNVLFSIWETRVRDFELFFKDDSALMPDWRSGENDPRTMFGGKVLVPKHLPPGAPAERPTWREPGAGYNQTPEHPVCGMDLLDARMFCAWLTWNERQEGRISEGQRYRVPTDEEWNQAALLIIHAKIPLSILAAIDEGDPNVEANFGGPEALEVQPWPLDTGSLSRRDPYPRTAPVGVFKPNALGIYDLSGNIAEWTDTEAPTRESASRARSYYIRGGSWGTNAPRACLLEAKQFDRMSRAKPIYGFRIVLDLKAAPIAPRPMN